MSEASLKAGKNQFKCFRCRLIFPNKEGNWVDWDAMQVHLCRACEKVTEQNPERNHRPY